MIPVFSTPIKSTKSFRGRSIQSSPLREKQEHIHPQISNTVKVNVKKFPMGFFIRIKGEEKLKTQQPNVQLNKAIRKSSACVLDHEARYQNIPEANVTSFFQVAPEYSDISDTNLSGNENEGKISDYNLTISDQDQLNIKQVSSSTGNNDYQCYGNELYLTFSKVPPTNSNFKISQCQNKTIKVENQREIKFPNKLRRPQTKFQTRGVSFEHHPKIINQNTKSFKNMLLETKSARLSRNIELFLPRISKRNN